MSYDFQTYPDREMLAMDLANQLAGDLRCLDCRRWGGSAFHALRRHVACGMWPVGKHSTWRIAKNMSIQTNKTHPAN